MPPLWSATVQTIWESDAVFPHTIVKKNVSEKASTLYRLKLIKKNAEFERYQLTYQGIPIWGYQVNVHKRRNDTLWTGVKISNIEKDIESIKPKLTQKEIETKIIKGAVKFKANEQIIFLDEKQKAYLAYHLSYFKREKGRITAPHFIIDAHTGATLKKWDNLQRALLGQGLGGNTLPLPYRQGQFQYGNAVMGLPSLGKFPIQIVNHLCRVEDAFVKVINLGNEHYSDAFFLLA